MPRPDSKKGSSPRRGAFRKVVLALWFVGVACVGLAGGIAWALFHALGGAGTVGTVVESMRHPGERAFGARDALYVLCLGIDYNHDSKGILYTKYARSDSVFVVRIDKQANTLSVVSIPRDMRVEIPGHGHDKINTAYSYKANGDLDLARKTVEQFLGVHIDHTVVIKPYAVEHVVDAFGGVDLDVERDMDYDDNWGNLHIHLKKGLQHLNGQQAVGYIRFRKDAEGDRGRMRRQQQFLRAMMAQLPRVGNLSRIGQVEHSLKTDISTSLGYDDLIDLAILYKGFDRKKMKSARVEGSDQLIDGTYYMVADEAQKRKVVAQLLRAGSDAHRPEAVRVEVLNGSGVSGAAARFAEVLRQQGYQVVRVGDADASPKTRLLDRLNDPQAVDALQRLVASRGGEVEVRRETAPSPSAPDADLTLVVGESYRPQ